MFSLYRGSVVSTRVARRRDAGWLNTALQAGLKAERFFTMHLVIAGTSGMNSLHSRIASGWQACCCSGVPCASAAPSPSSKIRPTVAALAAREDGEIVKTPAAFISEPVFLCVKKIR
jgi:hypothetical protein